MTNILKLILIFIVLPACSRVAEDRALRDLEVGKAAIEGLRVTVGEGRAAVRSLSRGELRVWAQAPSLTIEMAVGEAAGGPFSMIVENSMPDAELTGTTAGGDPIPAALADAPYPTERRFELNLPSSAAVTLTLSPPAAAGPLRVAVFADVQEAIDRIQDVYAVMNADPSIQFALMAGDLTERGEDPQFERFQRELKWLNFPCYATIGNHDVTERDGAFHDYFGRVSHSFEHRGVRFTMLDSAGSTVDPLVYERLDGWLADGKDKVHVVAMHVPPIDPVGGRNGSFASRAEADKFLSLLAAGRVDMIFHGHLHSYFVFESAGIPAYVTGGGGALPESFDGIQRHFLTIDIPEEGDIEGPELVRVD